MSGFAIFCVVVIGIIHVVIMFAEMSQWQKMGPRLLGKDYKIAREKGFDLVAATYVMAKNQGLYNGFLAAGLFWSLTISDGDWARCVAMFFVLCVGVAGVYGYATTKKVMILGVQGCTALVALIALYFSTGAA